MRVAGGAYLTCPLSKKGLPLERFLIDPPIRHVELKDEDSGEWSVEPIMSAWRLSSVGITIMEIPAFGPGYHVVDIVGAQHYPNVADFIEEVRHMGLSRRISRSSNFELLSRGSKVIIAHPSGWIGDWITYMRTEFIEWQRLHPCPRHEDKHTDWPDETMCARWWWQDILHGERTIGPASRSVRREMPSFSYEGAAPMDRPPDPPDRQLALVAAFPLHKIEVIKDPEGGKHEATVSKAIESSDIPVVLKDE